VPQTVFHFTLVAASIWPPIVALAGNAVVSELSLVDDAVGPSKLALAVEEAVEEVTLVAVAVFEGDFAGTIEAFAVDLAVLRGGGDLSFPTFVEDLRELDWKHHSAVHSAVI
jgi:hypothetical protein